MHAKWNRGTPNSYPANTSWLTPSWDLTEYGVAR